MFHRRMTISIRVGSIHAAVCDCVYFDLFSSDYDDAWTLATRSSLADLSIVSALDIFVQWVVTWKAMKISSSKFLVQ